MKQYIIRFINENIKEIKTLSIIMIIGIVIGILSFNFFYTDNISNSITETLNLTKTDGFEKINIINNGIVNNIYILIFYLLASITLISGLLIKSFLFLKGFSFGMFIAIIFNILGFKNGIVITIPLIITNIIVFISYIYISIIFLKSRYILFEKNSDKNKFYHYLRCISTSIFSYPFIILSVCLEQIIFYYLIKIY